MVPVPLQGDWRRGPPNIPGMGNIPPDVNPLLQPTPLGDWSELVDQERPLDSGGPQVVFDVDGDEGENPAERTTSRVRFQGEAVPAAGADGLRRVESEEIQRVDELTRELEEALRTNEERAIQWRREREAFVERAEDQDRRSTALIEHLEQLIQVAEGQAQTESGPSPPPTTTTERAQPSGEDGCEARPPLGDGAVDLRLRERPPEREIQENQTDRAVISLEREDERLSCHERHGEPHSLTRGIMRNRDSDSEEEEEFSTGIQDLEDILHRVSYMNQTNQRRLAGLPPAAPPPYPGSIFRDGDPFNPSTHISPFPPAYGEGEGRRRRRRRRKICAGWALAILLLGWIDDFVLPTVVEGRSTSPPGKDPPTSGRMEPLVLSMASGQGWQYNGSHFPNVAWDLAPRRVRPSTRERARTAATELWKNAWREMAIGNAAEVHLIERKTEMLLETLTNCRNPMLQMLSKRTLGEDVTEEENMLTEEVGWVNYCRLCHGEVCDSLCGSQMQDGFQQRKRRHAVQDWVNILGETNNLTIAANETTTGRPRLYPTVLKPKKDLIQAPQREVKRHTLTQPVRLVMEPLMRRLTPKGHFDDDPTPEAEARDPSRVSADPSLTAYDCSRPFHVKTVQSRTEEDCKRRRPVIKRRSGVQYLLLQEVPYLRLSAKKCQRTRSKLPVYCGNYDHETLALPDIWQNVPEEVSGSDCTDMHDSQAVTISTVPKDDVVSLKEFKLKLNSTNILTYEAFGTTSYDSSEVQCEGVKWYSESKGRYVSNMLEWRSDTINLDEAELLYDPVSKQLNAYQDQLTLPPKCNVARGKCITSQGTWVWAPPVSDIDNCRMHYIQTITGEEMIMQDGDEVVTIFVDNDKLIRFEVKESVVKCNDKVYPTNFNNFFLAEIGKGETFKVKELEGKDVDLASHFRQQGNWMAGQIRSSFEDFAQELLAALCTQDVGKYTKSFEALAARQNAIASGGAVNLKDGTFLTPVGEAWKIYRCQAVEVMPKEAETCYDSLPVQLPAGHQTLLFRNYTAPPHPPLFLEPISRLLTTEGAEVPCVPQFGLYYRTTQGRWLTSTPAIVEASAPPTLPSLVQHPNLTWSNMKYNFEGSGIYPDKVLLKMRQHLMMPRRRELVPHTILREIDAKSSARGDGMPGVVSAIHVPSPEEWGVMKQLEDIYSFLHDWGYVMSFVVGTYGLISLMGYFLKALDQCLFPEETTHFARRILKALIPTVVRLWDNCRKVPESASPQAVPETSPPGMRPEEWKRVLNMIRQHQDESRPLLRVPPVTTEESSALARQETLYRTLRKQIRELKKDLEETQSKVKRLTDDSDSSDAAGRGALPSLPPLRLPSVIKTEEFYETEVVPPAQVELRDSSCRPKSINRLLTGSCQQNAYTNMSKWFPAAGETRRLLPTAPPLLPTEEQAQPESAIKKISKKSGKEGKKAELPPAQRKMKLNFNIKSAAAGIRMPFAPTESVYIDAAQPTATSTATEMIPLASLPSSLSTNQERRTRAEPEQRKNKEEEEV